MFGEEKTSWRLRSANNWSGSSDNDVNFEQDLLLEIIQLI